MALSLTLLFIIILWAITLSFCLKYSWIDKELDQFGAFLNRIDHDRTSALLWAIGFFSLTQVRDFLENFVEQSEMIISFPMKIDYCVWMFGLYFWMVIYLRAITKESIIRISKWVLICWFLIYIAPIVDPFVYWGHHFEMRYVLLNPIKNFITFYGYCEYGFGATIGIKIEITLVCLAAGLFVATKTRSALKTIISMFVFYTLSYVFMAFPAIINPVMSNFIPNFYLNYPSQFNYFFGSLAGIGLIIYLCMFGKIRVEKFFKDLLSVLHFREFKLNFQILLALLKNIRPFRLIHYNLMALAGLLVALHYSKGGQQEISTLNIIFLHLSISFSWLFSVGINDLYDIPIDQISNKQRPLIKGSLSIENYKIFTFFALCLSLLFSSLLGYRVASVIFYFTVTYSFLYSAPPFRLKQFIIIPNLLIGLCNLIIFLSGMTLVYGILGFWHLPKDRAFFIFIAFSILSLVKDLKDEKGDARLGVMTLPTLLGIDQAKWVIGGLVAFVFLLIPAYVTFNNNWLIAGLCGLCGFWVVMQNKDWLIFAMWNMFLITACIIIGTKL